MRQESMNCPKFLQEKSFFPNCLEAYSHLSQNLARVLNQIAEQGGAGACEAAAEEAPAEEPAETPAE